LCIKNTTVNQLLTFCRGQIKKKVESIVAGHENGLLTVEIDYTRVMIKNIITIYNTEGEHV